MKASIFLATLVFGMNAMACNELVGTWQCKNEGAAPDTVKYEIVNGALVSTNIENGQPGAPVTLDGKERDENGMLYTATATCNGTSGTMALEFSTVISDDQGNTALLTGKGDASYQVASGGKSMTVNTKSRLVVIDTASGQAISDESNEANQTCAKQ